MEVTFFLSKVFGLYLLIMGLTMLLRGEAFKSRVNSMVSNPGVMLLTSIVTLIMGILLIVAHNIWVMDWRVVITVLCWLTFLKGVVRLWFPDMDKQAVKLIYNKMAYNFFMLLSLGLGVFCIYMGYYS